MMSIKTKVKLFVVGAILISLMAGIATAVIEVDGPTTITRGGVDDYGLFSNNSSVDGKFYFDIVYPDLPTRPCYSFLHNDEDLVMGLIVNPQTMKGEYGDRPPFFMEQRNLTIDDNTTGTIKVVPPVDRTKPGAFEELVPNGYMFPSEGEWIVPWDGERYYAYMDAGNRSGCNITMGTLYPEEFGVSGLKPGKYTLHVQKAGTEVAKEDTTDYNFEI